MGKLMEKSMETNLEEKMAQIKDFNYDYGKGKNWPFQLTQNLNADMKS